MNRSAPPSAQSIIVVSLTRCIRKRRKSCSRGRMRSIRINRSIRRKSGAACAISHRVTVRQGRPGFSCERPGLLASCRMLKRPNAYSQRYVEGRSETRTPMVDVGSILLKKPSPSPQYCKEGDGHSPRPIPILLLDHQNLAADMSRMQMAAIGQCIPLSRVEHVAGGNPDVLRFTRLQHHFSFHDKR